MGKGVYKAVNPDGVLLINYITVAGAVAYYMYKPFTPHQYKKMLPTPRLNKRKDVFSNLYVGV